MDTSAPIVYALIHAASETPGLLGEVLAESGYQVREIHAYKGDSVPENIDDASALLVMGGPVGVYEADAHPYLREEKQLIADSIDKEIPVLGICLGSQLIASVLGASVYKGKQKEIGWFPVYLEKAGDLDPLFAQLSPAFTGFHWHGDVFDLPKGAVSLARSELTTCQAFRYQDNVYGILCHLEVTPKIIEEMTAAFDAELQVEKISKEILMKDCEKYIQELNRLGRMAFSAWVQSILGQGQELQTSTAS